MALIKCPECEKQVSSAAVSCPSCGHPIVGGVAPQARTPRWSPGVAAVLSLIIPGAGQLYKGQVLNGLVWFGATVVGYVMFIAPGLLIHLCCVVGASMGDPYK
jgi:hypothetical protein